MSKSKALFFGGMVMIFLAALLIVFSVVDFNIQSRDVASVTKALDGSRVMQVGWTEEVALGANDQVTQTADGVMICRASAGIDCYTEKGKKLKRYGGA